MVRAHKRDAIRRVDDDCRQNTDVADGERLDERHVGDVEEDGAARRLSSRADRARRRL